jgi:hypothetical protein
MARCKSPPVRHGPGTGIDIGGGYRWFFYPEDEVLGTYYVQVGLVLWF